MYILQYKICILPIRTLQTLPLVMYKMSRKKVLAMGGSVLRRLLEDNDNFQHVARDGRNCGFVKTSKVYSRKTGRGSDEVVSAQIEGPSSCLADRDADHAKYLNKFRPRNSRWKENLSGAISKTHL